MSRVNVTLYRSAIRQVWSDGVLTKEEEASLENLRQSLNIPDEVHEQLLVENGEEIYKNALWWAWEDGKMEPHESEELERLRKLLKIDDERHERLEEIVRREIKKLEGVDLGGEEQWSLEGVIPDYRIVEVEAAPTGDESDEMEVPNGAEPLTWQEYLLLGSAMYQNQDFERAIAFFDRTLSENANCGKAQFFRKKAAFRLKGMGVPIPKPEEHLKAKLYWKVSLDALAAAKPKTETKDRPVPASVTRAAEAAAAAEAAKAAEEDEVETETEAAAQPFTICISCGGEGKCSWCKGEGKCTWCRGSGNCTMCNGTGTSFGKPCTSCNGTGDCSSCKGEGKCYWCDGTGSCSRCKL